MNPLEGLFSLKQIADDSGEKYDTIQKKVKWRGLEPALIVNRMKFYTKEQREEILKDNRRKENNDTHKSK
jgi:hypothetical protein